jgi:hypothetical protein
LALGALDRSRECGSIEREALKAFKTADDARISKHPAIADGGGQVAIAELFQATFPFRNMSSGVYWNGTITAFD